MGGPGARAGIVTVGDELLLGQVVDTNAGWLSAALSDLGIPVVRRWTVGDVDAHIREALGAALEDTDLVVVSGGLGPTDDDRTRDAVAAHLGLELREDERWMAFLRERFARHGFGSLPETNRRQCLVPEGAELLPNSRGTAPGLLLETEGRFVVLLPGVPRELKALFADEVRPRVLERLGDRARPATERRIATTGIAESALAERVEPALERARSRSPSLAESPVEIGFYPDLHGVELVLRVRGMDEDGARAAFDEVEAVLAPIVERFRFPAPGGDLVEALGERLRERSATVAVAESCTGGLLGKRLSERAGSSDFFLGGVVAYADRIKTEQLGVPEALIQMHGAVSEEVARAMAEGVADRFASDGAIGVTGIAGPGGGTEEKPVGLVWYAACWRGRTRARNRVFPGDREAVRERSGQAALALLYRMIGDADD